jgi:hypothetical protein
MAYEAKIGDSMIFKINIILSAHDFPPDSDIGLSALQVHNIIVDNLPMEIILFHHMGQAVGAMEGRGCIKFSF